MYKRAKITRRQFVRQATKGAAALSLSAGASATNASKRADAILEVADWRKAASAGWNFTPDAEGRHVSVLGKVAHVAVDRDGETAEIAYTQPTVVPERFALTIRMRLLKIGQDDDSTGPKSNLQLTLGVKSPHGDFGLGFQFIADRYKVDDQYKIFRTKDDWHDWLFEVDTRKKTVAMSRDGEYVCLHRGGAPQPPGVRFEVKGSATVPAIVEIGELRVVALPPEEATSPRRKRRNTESFAPGEWPMWRRDARNTGHSPLVGHLKEPRVAWHIPVGGVETTPTFLDVDGDGQKEALVSYGGNLSVYRPDGTLLWKERTENATVYGVFDLDGDGQSELLLASGAPAQARVLRGKDGKTLYTCDQFVKAGVMSIRVAKLDPAKKGLQAVVWSPLHEIGYCLSFADGVENAKVDYTFDWQMTGFTPTVAFADMDRDGLPEIVIGTYDHVFVVDGRTGTRKMELQTPMGRNYGNLVVKDIDGDGYPDVALLSDVLREHIAVVKNEAGKSLRLLWDKFYEQNYPEDHKELRVLTESVDDFDGDGRIEIVYGLFDDLTDAKWHTLVVDAVSGTIKADLPGRYPAGAGVLFPGKPPVLFLSAPSGRTALNVDKLTVWSGQNGAWKEQAKLPTGTLLAPKSPLDFPLNAWGQISGIGTGAPTTVIRPQRASDSQRGLFLVRPGSKADPRAVAFLTGDAAGQIKIERQTALPAGIPTGTVVGIEEAIPDANGPQILFSGSDGVVRIVDAKGELRGTVNTQAGFVTAPVTAKLRENEPPSLLFIDSKGEVCCMQSPGAGGTPQKRWSRSSLSSPHLPIINQLRPLGCPCIPMVVDLRGGEREILIAQMPNHLTALNADGETTRSWKLPALPVQWTFGDFDGDDTLDLFVTYTVGQWVDVESVALAGKDGRPLWHAHCGNAPAAIYDLDGDGFDDVTLRDLYEHRTLNGRTGRDISPITQWAGYHTPVIVPLGGAMGVVWTGGAYSLVVENLAGEQKWWKPFQATGLEAVADVDGDGRMEVGGVTAGQLYNWPKFYPVDGPDKEFLCLDAATGEVKWTFPVGTTASGVASADVDGDGRPEFLFGTADGRLIALRGGPEARSRKVFEVSLPASLGMPVVCDADGDSAMEILVSCADGNLYCIKSA